MDSNITAKVILDAQPELGHRITTLEVTMPKFLVAQLNTHRSLCLAGDSILEFELPTGSYKKGYRRIYTMPIAEFVDKWHNGDSSTSRRTRVKRDLSGFIPDNEYSPNEVAQLLGYAHAANILLACREGKLQATKYPDKTWGILGKDVVTWYNTPASNITRRKLQHRLKDMRIRQLNEDTGNIETSTVVDAMYSGIKPVFTIHTSNGRQISGSSDHLIKTPKGYTAICDLSVGDLIMATGKGVLPELRLDPKRCSHPDGKSRSQWQRQQRKRMGQENPLCRECNATPAKDIHHVLPVHSHPELAFEEENITFLCEKCHKEKHLTPDWQLTGSPLHAKEVQITDIVYRGEELTYDIEIAGNFPNFIANGICVHNCKNSASSRAIPITQFIHNILESPVTPAKHNMPANSSGMVPKSHLKGIKRLLSIALWNTGIYLNLGIAYLQHKLGLHKSWANRPLEAYYYTKVLITATEWDNFFKLRLHKDAQDAMYEVAHKMRDAIDSSFPIRVSTGYWYLPYVGVMLEPTQADLDISVSCCAQVSFRTLDMSPDKANRIVNKLLGETPHWSPFEHIAVLDYHPKGSYKSWNTYRHILDNN